MAFPLRPAHLAALAAVVVAVAAIAYVGLRSSSGTGADTATVPAASPAEPAPGGADSASHALERGNTAFRAGSYEDALMHYRTAARAAPSSAAPHYGIHMAARKLDDGALADSAHAAITRLADTTSAARDSTPRAVPAPGGEQ